MKDSRASLGELSTFVAIFRKSRVLASENYVQELVCSSPSISCFSFSAYPMFNSRGTIHNFSCLCDQHRSRSATIDHAL